MTHRERMITALTLGTPDRIPTFELEFQLPMELIGKDFLTEDGLKGCSPKEIEYKINDNVEFLLELYGKLEHDAIPLHYLNEEHLIMTAKRLRKVSGDEYMLLAHGDGTFCIMDGPQMADFSYRLYDDPDSVREQAEQLCRTSLEHNRRFLDAGFDGFILCSDYCFNKGPFISPKMFAEFVTPYLTRLIADIRDRGGYAIKHTDGNIMPILDQLLSARPHAIHSLDPMAGVDIAEVKRLTKGKCAIVGNVNCALMQTGTEEQVAESARYCLKHGKPGGGYIFSTSNVPFKGLPLERYMIALDEWKKQRDY